MTWQIPWAISGVTEIPLEVSRVLSFVATGGAEGVVGPGDLLVRATATPSGSVRIAPGAFAANNRFSTAGPSQSYIGYNTSEVTKAIAPQGASGTRYEIVYAHVLDPTYDGTVTGAPVETRVFAATSTTTSLKQVAPTTSGLALALLTIPANTATITQAMITDLRALVTPRRQDLLRTANLPNGAAVQNMGATMVNFPSQAVWTIAVPSWATRAQVTAFVDGLQVTGTAGQGAGGSVRVVLGANASANTEYNANIAGGTFDTFSSMTAVEFAVDSTIRGTNQTLALQANKTVGTGTARAAWGTTVIVQVAFLEAPDALYWG